MFPTLNKDTLSKKQLVTFLIFILNFFICFLVISEGQLSLFFQIKFKGMLYLMFLSSIMTLLYYGILHLFLFVKLPFWMSILPSFTFSLYIFYHLFEYIRF